MLKLLRNPAGISVIDQSLVSGINFITGIYFAYKLGITAFGQYSLILLIVQFCLEIQRSVVNSPMFIFSAEQENEIYLASLYPLQLLISIALSILAGGFIYASGFVFEKWQISQFDVYTVFFCFAKLQQEFYRRYFFAQQKAHKTLSIDLLYALILVVGLIVKKDNLTLQILLFLGILSSFLPLIFYKIRFSCKNLKSVADKHYHFSKWLFASSIANYLSSNLLLFIGSAIIGSAAAGILKLSQYIMGGMIILYQAAENIIPHRLAGFVNGRQRDGLNSFFKKYLLIAFCLNLFHSIVIYSFLDTILYHINNGSYDQQQYQLAIGYIIFSFLLTLSYSLQYWLRAFRKTNVIFFASIASAIMVIGFSKFLINRYQVMGILFGFFLSQISAIIIYGFYSFKAWHENRSYSIG